ncbi:MAG: CIA30 family protein [Planctomycetota bacterium]|jgi:uncharacterized surface protein with fasciclin (FAS1) repeats
MPAITVATAATAAIASLALAAQSRSTAPFELSFAEGADGWRVVVDGVMGGRSTGRIESGDGGTLRFTGTLSLENNGGFSQIRRSVPGGVFAGADGVDLRVRGDGRTYTFNVRCTNARVMAGGFQADFATNDGGWTDVRLPFSAFRLYSFGRAVAGAPELAPELIESIGVTLADKQAGPFRLEIDRIAAFTDAGAAPGAMADDLESVARSAGLTTLLELVAAAELELPAEGRFTIFAPTNDAFAALPAEQVQVLLRAENRQLLRTVLAQHVVPMALSSAALLDRRAVDTLAGQRLAIDPEAIAVGGSALVATDVAFDRGVVHVIDSVLLPESRSIAELAAADGRFALLLRAVEAAGLAGQLGPGNGPWTVLAPTDDAFAALPAGALEALLEPGNRDRLVEILALHVIPGRVYRKDLLAVGTASTLANAPVTFAVEDGRLLAGGAGIVAADIQASNGVVHVIDRVILPAQPAETPAPASPAIAMIERAVSIGAPLYNEGNAEACAVVYQITIESLLTLAPDRLARDTRRRLERSLVEASRQPDRREQAWIYRRAMDDAYARLVSR